MRINLLDFVDYCITNILHIDFAITIVVVIFILYARSREIYYAKDNKEVIALNWHWRIVGTIILWGIFVVATLLYHFST